jgi:hypothetical protein
MVREEAGAGATVRLTPTDCVPRVVLSETDPEYCPAASPAGVTETVSVWLVLSAPDGVTLSQFGLPAATVAPAVNAVRFVARTESVCGAGAPPPAVALNASELGLKVSWPLPRSSAMPAVVNPIAAARHPNTTGFRVISAPSVGIRPPGIRGTVCD